ncbi:LacI family DNA-binding transcriptional regulator [Microbacterium sp. BK668]|uniref:LacI family DNA-binding transcriptional regulator n=1 Tax=Microbacterium sp. BK668 TaxID=2512118 RepID=UPI00105EC50E|nr:LacI family DNA-binding transcriptional regulator [Microbacterium sp. BK668]TDN91475.1 LacI family transcriptional regulator [Microbacterium sp. BK668]
MARGRATIKDVAAAVGVSTTTVSHVLNEVPGKRISSDTRARVFAAADKLGYAPNALARSLRTQRSNTIAIIGDEIATTPFAGKIILGAQDVALRRDSVVFVVNTGYRRDVEAREIDELLRRQVDGVLYASMYHREVELPAALRAVPTVVVNATCADERVPWVTPDELAGGEDAAAVLLTAGHRRIAFINDEDPVAAAVGRERGFLRAVEASAAADADVMVLTAESGAEGGYHAGLRLLGGYERPTGIFCFNDRVAMGVYRAAYELGVRIPRDVSIVGFDNQDFIADGIAPSLTTIELPHYEMGAWATERLFDLISESAPAGPAPHTRLRGPVIHRHSVAPPSQDSSPGERRQPADRRGNA